MNISRSGIKKDHCLRHGMLTELNTHISYEKTGIRKRCSICRKSKQPLQKLNRSLKENRAFETSRHKGITLQQYDQMFIDQNNRCAICNKEETCLGRDGKTIKRLCIDHCHETGKIRGLLCHACNTAIGKLKDKVELLESAIKYLRRNQ